MRRFEPPTKPQTICIVFDGPPSHESGRFVEVEDTNGRGMSIGRWVERPDGLWALEIDNVPVLQPHTHGVGTMVGKHIDECAYCGLDLRHPIHLAKAHPHRGQP